VERGNDLRGKENETESWVAAEEAENNNNNVKRSGNSETEENRAMVFCFAVESADLGSESDDTGFYL